jgi:predicted outer membrane protein
MKTMITLVTSICLISSAVFAADPSTPASDVKTSVTTFQNTTVLNDIHHANEFEIKLAGLANTNSSSTEVKAASQHMIQDHQQAYESVKTLAMSENVPLGAFQASDSEQGVLDSLSNLHGRAFDVAYLDFQRDLHKGLAAQLTMISSEEKNPSIKSLIKTILPTVKHHEQMSASLEQTAKNNMAGEVAE